MSSHFGQFFKITTFGESHGGAVGVVIDGCPAGHTIEMEKIQAQLSRRRPGQSALSTPREESDLVECLSGIEDGKTLGSPICLIVRNKNFRKEDYQDIKKSFRPSHADYTTLQKYGISAQSGGGRASARETIGRVAAAALADQILENLIPDFRVTAWVDSVKDLRATVEQPMDITRQDVDRNDVRCPNKSIAKQMEKTILDAKKSGDSVGGTLFCGIQNCPPGLGEPIFDKLEADLAKAMMSLPATKGFEIGSGFDGTRLLGSEHNDEFYQEKNRIRTKTNRSGGIQGGISNGEYIYMRVAFKPVSTIFKEQNTVNTAGENVKFKPKAGRHDPCVLPRAVPIVEAMATLVVMDHYLRQQALSTTSIKIPN